MYYSRLIFQHSVIYRGGQPFFYITVQKFLYLSQFVFDVIQDLSYQSTCSLESFIFPFRCTIFIYLILQFYAHFICQSPLQLDIQKVLLQWNNRFLIRFLFLYKWHLMPIYLKTRTPTLTVFDLFSSDSFVTVCTVDTKINFQVICWVGN
jgi:hypothetical protein